jgi:tetratricopeptide (TPR) repeat protein
MVGLALVVIARNEARCIERCLRSAKPFVDEMIVLDTGSSDATVEIAVRLGARVEHFVWNDDFSAARNAALDLSSARWNLVLDADEWIDPAAAKGVLAKAIAASAPFLGLLPIASQFDLQGSVDVATSWIPRLLPRGVRYEGRIHEQPSSRLPRHQVQLPVMHDGYRENLLDQKRGRNEVLLLKALAETPADPYLLYELGKNYEVYENYDKAVARYQQALIASRPDDAFRHDLVVRTIFSMKTAQQHETAIHLAEAEMPNWQNSPDFFFALGDLLLDWANLNPPDAVEQLLGMVEASWLRCIEIGDRPGLSGSVVGRGSHLAAYNLAVFYRCLGDAAQADRYQLLATGRRQ